jgi:hypothetical protein
MAASVPDPGWYPDPTGSPNWRYWDGTQWTEQTKGYFLPVREVLGQPLVLRGGGLNPKAQDLMYGNEVVVRLGWGGLVNRMQGDLTIESSDGSWRIDQRFGFPPTHLLFDHSGQIAAMEWQITSGTGTLTFNDGRRFVWKAEWVKTERYRTPPTHHGQWWLWDQAGRAVIGTTYDNVDVAVTANPAAADVPELALFTGLGAYLVLRWLDSQVHRDRRD